MSGVRMEGRMPKPGEIMAVVDAGARSALVDAKNVVLPLVRQEAPGGLGDALTGSVRKTPTGYRATIAPPRRKPYGGGAATGAQVVRWVSRGTGIYRKGPGRKRPITGKHGVLRPMKLPGGRTVRSVKGQKPNPFLARAETRAHAPVTRTLEDGAREVARRLRAL